MKKLICYLKTIKDFKVFINALISFGAIYVAHDYVEVSNKYIKSRNRFESRLVCQVCGDTSISWRK